MIMYEAKQVIMWVSTALKVFACLAFLTFAVILWQASGGKWLVFLLLLLPCYACEEWLSEKIFSEHTLVGARLSLVSPF